MSATLADSKYDFAVVSDTAGIRICKEINGDIEFFDENYGPMFLSVDRALDLITIKYTVTPITYDGISIFPPRYERRQGHATNQGKKG